MDGATDDGRGDGDADDGAAAPGRGSDESVVLAQGRGFSRVPGWVMAQQHLRHLNLSFNKLASLDALASMTALKVLNVSHNRLASLRGVEGLKCLQVLKAHDNGLCASAE